MSESLFDIGPTYGALFLGVVICAILFGGTNLQVFWYYTTYHDSIYVKLAVAWLWLLDALHMAFVTHSVYWYLVSNFATPLSLFQMVWSFKLQITINIVLIASVQTFYSIRLYRLNSGRSKVVPCVVTVLLLFAYGVSIMESYKEFGLKEMTEINTIRTETFISLACISIVDSLIAVTSCFVLAQYRTGSARADSVITTLMLYVMNTGLLTSICSIVSIITYAVKPNTLVFLSIELVSSKLYVNSYMAMLNARNRLKTKARTGNNAFTSIDVEASRGAFDLRFPSSPTHQTFKGTASMTSSFGMGRRGDDDTFSQLASIPRFPEPAAVHVEVTKETFSSDM